MDDIHRSEGCIISHPHSEKIKKEPPIRDRGKNLLIPSLAIRSGLGTLQIHKGHEHGGSLHMG